MFFPISINIISVIPTNPTTLSQTDNVDPIVYDYEVTVANTAGAPVSTCKSPRSLRDGRKGVWQEVSKQGVVRDRNFGKPDVVRKEE